MLSETKHLIAQRLLRMQSFSTPKVLGKILRMPVTFEDVRPYTFYKLKHMHRGEDIQSLLQKAHRPKV